MFKVDTTREMPLEMSPEQFRKVGYELIDQISGYLNQLPELPVSPDVTEEEIFRRLGKRTMPQQGADAGDLLSDAVDLLKANSTFNGHPRFLGYITSSASPIGALGDMLAGAINSNVGLAALAPMATAIEQQTMQWLAELIGYPATGGGLLVSGGNMANITAFWAARRAKAGWDIRKEGLASQNAEKLVAYASAGVHTWIQKAADLSGLGLDAIRRVAVDGEGRLMIADLRRQIEADVAAGFKPFLVAGTAGTVELGAVDPLFDIAEVAGEYDLWFHVDGAYGAVAALLPESPADLRGMALADSIAFDPHKWLYAPLEAGAILVKDPNTLVDAFSFHPTYYDLEDDTEPSLRNLYEYGPQNSRGFRALKVWLTLQQAGREGYETMLRDDIAASRHLYGLADLHPELEAVGNNLSITTFRYVPEDLAGGELAHQAYLNELNAEILNRLIRSGEAFVSKAELDGRFVLRACVVNFRTTLDDMFAVSELVVSLGRELDAAKRGWADSISAYQIKP